MFRMCLFISFIIMHLNEPVLDNLIVHFSNINIEKIIWPWMILLFPQNKVYLKETLCCQDLHCSLAQHTCIITKEKKGDTSMKCISEETITIKVKEVYLACSRDASLIASSCPETKVKEGSNCFITGVMTMSACSFCRKAWLYTQCGSK